MEERISIGDIFCIIFKIIFCLTPLAGLALICSGCFAFGAQPGVGENILTAGAAMFGGGLVVDLFLIAVGM